MRNPTKERLRMCAGEPGPINQLARRVQALARSIESAAVVEKQTAGRIARLQVSQSALSKPSDGLQVLNNMSQLRRLFCQLLYLALLRIEAANDVFH